MKLKLWKGLTNIANTGCSCLGITANDYIGFILSRMSSRKEISIKAHCITEYTDSYDAKSYNSQKNTFLKVVLPSFMFEKF